MASNNKVSRTETEKGMADAAENEPDFAVEEVTGFEGDEEEYEELESVETDLDEEGYSDEECPLSHNVAKEEESQEIEAAEIEEEATRNEEPSDKDEEESMAVENGLENNDIASGGTSSCDEEVAEIMKNAGPTTKRSVSFKPETSVRIIVPNGPLPNRDIFEPIPSTSSAHNIMNGEGIENMAYIDEEVPLADDISEVLEKEMIEVMEKEVLAMENEEKKKKAQEENDATGFENPSYNDEKMTFDEELSQILGESVTQRNISIIGKPETSVRCIVANGPVPDHEIIEMDLPSCSGAIAINEDEMEEINITDVEPESVNQANVTYMKQKKPKNNFFNRKLEIDLAPEPVALPNNLIAQRARRPRCSEEMRQRWVQCGCIILIVIIVVLLIFVKDKDNTKHN